MQSLLSPSESHAFQSFLSNMDYADDSITPSEWALFNSQSSGFPMQDDTDPNPEQREALTKATKDLMSLDAEGWDVAHLNVNQNHLIFDPQNHYSVQQQEQHFAQQHQVLEDHQRHQHLQHLHHQEQQQQNGFSDLFPFLHNKPPHLHQLATQELRYPMQRQQQHPLSDHGSPITPSHSNPFSAFQNPQHPTQPHQVHIPSHSEAQPRVAPASGSATRSRRLSARPTTGLAVSTSSGNSLPRRVRSSSSPALANKPDTHNQQVPGAPKQPQALLSPSQKKANHIQSEQKRRANIRRGYEALCETVPALREAIREEEEAERNAANGVRGAGNAAPRKKGRSKKGQKDSDEKEKDKLDGRAGPRSENVVLSKTIDHIQDLISDRSALLARLHRARSSLPPGHPALTPLVADPPWEREWKGGNGRLGDEDPEGEGESDGEEDGEEGE